MRKLSLCFVLLLLGAAPAFGQVALVQPALSVFVEDPGRAFQPGAIEAVTVLVNYNPGQGGRPTPAPTPDRPEGSAPTRVVVTAKVLPSWVTDVTFEPPELLIVMGIENTSGNTPRRVTALLNVSRDAPALEREPFVVTATASPNGNIQGATAESPEIRLRATTIGLLNVSAAPSVVIPGGRWTDVPFTVRNDGNSEIVAKINVTVRPENSQVEFIDTLQLARGASEVVTVRLRVPWTNAEPGTLEVQAVPIVDSEDGPIARAEVDVRGQSAVPAPGILPLALLLIGVALAARRAQRPSR